MLLKKDRRCWYMNVVSFEVTRLFWFLLFKYTSENKRRSSFFSLTYSLLIIFTTVVPVVYVINFGTQHKDKNGKWHTLAMTHTYSKFGGGQSSLGLFVRGRLTEGYGNVYSDVVVCHCWKQTRWWGIRYLWGGYIVHSNRYGGRGLGATYMIIIFKMTTTLLFLCYKCSTIQHNERPQNME